MNSTLTITRREFRSNFDSPIAYVVIALSLLFVGWLFFSQFWTINCATVGPLFYYLPWAFVFPIIPAVTMRLFAEEKRTGTIELLITMPVRDRDGRARKVPGDAGAHRGAAGALAHVPHHDLADLQSRRTGAPCGSATSGCSSEASAAISIGLSSRASPRTRSSRSS